ncbi:restriction endonuclease subunit S [Pseudomonas savastanoi pv. phaseolicola]|uniref:restriction endonuclease subunit S n=1 Tax=Pseudomonas savastanoi TaxID=29438 RepID=UPI000F0043D0|nr:restriction endonuclease subunit S [Pseudomonas savastanoi]MBN3470612.1 restriction endonuclease subunit S [Pseudomonas savastanoi pv. phaseolicola]MBN3477625.1 restriction endonuclease subunit S [Pseudomonas savastanoi pv. phaseolicola]RMO29439.1 Type I restriction modification DNA specificity domain protein [Pseudomonas savastanoi pv. glycinea]RMU08244.1 Type I restriction modification DNA specificity domain protein [Pseudomonas savastanoi pv. glycinea]
MSGNERKPLEPRLRFPEFRAEGGWNFKFGNLIFDQISNKDHNSDLPVLAITQEQGAIPREMIDYHVSVTDKSLESYKVVEVGDFIISLRSFQGGIEFSRYRGICSPAYVILRLRRAHSEDYFRHYLKTDRFIAQMTKNLEGLRDGKMISYKQFSELALPIPLYDEQQKIADCLSFLDDLIAAETQKLDALKTQKKGLMLQLFPREGETVPQLRFPEFQNGDEWDARTIGDMFHLINGYAFKPEDWESNGTPIIRIQNLNDPSAEFNYSQSPVPERNRIEPGDLLFAWSGTLGVSFGARIWNGPPGVLNQHIFKVLMDEQQITLPFALLIFLRVEEDIAKQAHGFKASFVHVRKSDIIKIKLLLPSLPEQQRIASCLSSLDELVGAQKQKIDTLKTHKRGLMQQLFPVLDKVSA